MKSKKKILIVEDDPLLNKMYGMNFREGGMKVQFAEDGKQAIDAIDKEIPDILLLDLLMPRVDGFQVLQHIRTKKYVFPIIVLSNLSQKVDQHRCAELGAKEYFVKSDIDLEELAAKVQKYLS